MGSIPDDPVAALVEGARGIARRCGARDAAIPRPGRRACDDERARSRGRLAGGVDPRVRARTMGAPGTAAGGAHATLDPHLWHHHVSADSAQANLDPGRAADSLD